MKKIVKKAVKRKKQQPKIVRYYFEDVPQTYSHGGNVKNEYNQLVGRSGDEYYFLNYIFHHSDGFKGATGDVIMPVSKSYYDYAMSREGIIERYIDSMGEDEWIDVIGIDREEYEDEDKLIEAIEDGIYDLFLAGQLHPFEEVNYDAESQMRKLPQFQDSNEFPIFEVVGGGRIFSGDISFDDIYNQELYDKIKEVEGFKEGGELNKMVKIYYNSQIPFYKKNKNKYEIFENTPFVVVPKSKVNEVIHDHYVMGDWKNYLVPELMRTEDKIIHHRKGGEDYAKGGGVGKKYYWITMDRNYIDEYIDYASNMYGMFEGEIYTQAPNKVAFDTQNDMFAFTSMIDNYNNDNDFQESDEGYIHYEELFNGEPRENIWDRIIGNKYAKGGGVSTSDLETLISEINEKNDATFYLRGAYGNYELWAKDKNGGDHRIEVGSRKDIREALIKNRYNEKYQKYANGGGVNDCIEYIKNSESIKNNGYYLLIDNMNNYVGANSVNIPKINSLCMITFNSGGQNNLKAVDTINSTMLALEISKLLNIDIEIARIIVYEQTTYSKPFTMDVLKDIENKNIIVADMDKIVCDNLSKTYAVGGETSDYYEQLAVYVQGVGSIYNGTSMKKAKEKANSYLNKNKNAEIVIVDEKYGDEYDLDGNMKDEYAKGGGVGNRGGLFSIGDKVMVKDEGYVKSFQGFDLSQPATIISKNKVKFDGKTKYTYGLEFADGRKPFNNASETKLSLVKYAKGGGVGKKSKGGIGKSGTQYGYTLKEWEEMAKNKGLLVSPKEWWKSQEGKTYTDSFGRKKKIGQHSQDERQSMEMYGYLIANGLDLGSEIIPTSAKKYVQENNYIKYANGGRIETIMDLSYGQLLDLVMNYNDNNDNQKLARKIAKIKGFEYDAVDYADFHLVVAEYLDQHTSNDDEARDVLIQAYEETGVEIPDYFEFSEEYAEGGGVGYETQYNLRGWRKSQKSWVVINKNPMSYEDAVEMLNNARKSGLYDTLEIESNMLKNPNYATLSKNEKGGVLHAKGGGVGDSKIKDWYIKNHPTDDLGERINDNVTFEDLWNEDYKKYSVYDVIGVGDSVIRERLFEHLAEIKGVSYDVVYKRLFSTDYYADGGSADLDYNEIFNVLKSKIDDAIDNIPNEYESASQFKGEEIEHESRSGFIPYTDGGYEAVWFETLGALYSSGYNLPTKPLDDEMNRQIDYNLQSARESFGSDYPEIVEELGEENIDYNSLVDAGYSDEAEELSNAEMDMMWEDTILMRIFANYYNPENSRAKDGKHTIRLFGDVNLESPYHRTGNLDDSYEYEFTFDSIDELENEMAIGIAYVIAWFEGGMYNDSTAEMKVRRMEEGGQAGRKSKKTTKKKQPKMVRQYFEDKPYSYAEGGEVEDWMEEALESLIEETGNDNLEITYVHSKEFYCTDGDAEYRVFKTEEDAEETAIEQVREDLKEMPESFNQEWLTNFFEADSFFRAILEEYNYGYATDIMTEDDGLYANRLIREMVDWGIMTEEQAMKSDAEQIASDNIQDFVNLLTDDQCTNGAFEYYANEFGEEEAYNLAMSNNLIDFQEASENAVMLDGIGHFLSSYDGETIYLTSNSVAYRTN